MNIDKLVKDYVSRTRNDSLNDVIIKCLPLPTCVGNGRPLMMTSLLDIMSLINQYMVTNMLPNTILEVTEENTKQFKCVSISMFMQIMQMSLSIPNSLHLPY